MTTTSTRHGEDPPPLPYDEDRYVALGSGEREVVIFDREMDSAWVKSDGAIELGERR